LLESAFPDGGFPPVVAIRFADTYFVIDGHHRVALARKRRANMIEADITEFVSRVPLPAGADTVEVILRQLERVFVEESGLADARSGLRVSASRPAVYLELLENLQVHGYHLMREQGRVMTESEIAADWYERIYGPVIDAVDRDRLGKQYRDAPNADPARTISFLRLPAA
jgi:hypothetical protein